MSTTFGWDASHYDAPPTQRDGIDFYTHKCAEGHHFYRDAEYGDAMNKARGLEIPVLGSYFVNHPGTVSDQADWWIELVNKYTPWWRDFTYWIWQIDAEKFKYMSREPSFSEIRALADQIVSKAKVPESSVIVYAPSWLYGDSLKGLRYKLWESDYGSNPAIHYRKAYPGNNSFRWAFYSGQVPIILQYGSRTTIGNQTTCDANAFRGTVQQLKELLIPKEGVFMALSDAQQKEIYDVCHRLNSKPPWAPEGFDLLRGLETLWYTMVLGKSGTETTWMAQQFGAVLDGLKVVPGIDEAKIDEIKNELIAAVQQANNQTIANALRAGADAAENAGEG